ncbi:MAG: protein kinase [Myxococcota bacterium]
MLRPGTLIADRYTVVRTIGAGGMGTVYEIKSTSLGNRLALKVLASKFAVHKSVVARFHQEARFQATITHPGITRVFELVQEEDLLGIVMEFVQAPTLRDVMDEGPMPHDQVRGVIRELLSTLGACHKQGIAHRDLKPENIFVFTDNHGDVRCKLADFGVAKLLTPDASEPALTRAHHFLGTPMYASPEQVERSASIDGRSDLYSLGVVMWEMLSGEEPYADLTTSSSLQVAVVTDDLGPLPGSVPKDLRRVVDALTQKERDARPATARRAMALLGVGPERPLDRSDVGRADPLLAAVIPPSTPAAETFEFPIPRKAQSSKRPYEPRPQPRTASPSTPTPAAESAPAMTPAGSALVLREKDPVSPPLEPNSVRQSRGASAREDRLAALVTANGFARLGGRLFDECLLQLLVLSCVGILIYPFVAPLRGAFTGRSLGSAIVGVQVFNARTGRPASFGQMLLRNLTDLFSFQLAIVAIVFPLGWFWFVPLFGLAWLLVFGSIEVLFMAAHPKGRRVADLMAGTRVAWGTSRR